MESKILEARVRLKEPPSNMQLATSDLIGGFLSWRVWGLIAWQDIKQRYRRSFLGPFWITLSMGTMVGALGILYAKLFRIPTSEYVPFLTLGLLAWGLIYNSLVEGCDCYTSGEAFIKQIKMPYSTHVYRVVWRNILIFSHNLPIYVVVIAIFGPFPGINGLIFFTLGLIFLTLNCIWAAILLGLLSARFRDIPPIITSLLQVVLFITPIFWKPEMLGKRAVAVKLNPLYHFIEIIRSPLLGKIPPSDSCGVVLIATLIGWIITFLFYQRYRARIPYWV